jgi:CubicO group peptidase (beta-lactamase class C family)
MFSRWLIFLIGATLGAQDFTPLSRFLDGERSKRRIPGYAAAVYYNGETRWTRAAGIADRKANRPVRRDTPFRIASISKSLTATAVMQMVEMRLLRLEDDVRQYCPAYPVKPFPITLGQLLGHQGGIRHYRLNVDADVNNTQHFSSVQDALRKFAADPLEHPPGAKFLYTTYGYTLLGCAMEGASGLSYEQWMADKLLATVGMCDTAPDNGQRVGARRAQGYRIDTAGEVVEAVPVDNSVKLPGGGYVSTAEDLMRFVDGLYRQKLVRSELLEQMWTSGRLASGKATGYGLGFSVGRLAGGDREVYHTGSQQGASCLLYLRPAERFAFVWLTNLERVENRVPLARQVYRLTQQILNNRR